MGSFFGSLRRELLHHCVYYTRNEARADVFCYIELFYNRRRRHSALDYLSPEVCEQIPHQGYWPLLNSLSAKSGEDRIQATLEQLEEQERGRVRPMQHLVAIAYA